MSERQAYISGLRKLADLLEGHDELPLPTTGVKYMPLEWLLYQSANARSELAAITRALPSGVEKRTGEFSGASGWFGVNGTIDGLHVAAKAYRETVCERIVVGTRQVTRTVPDPKAPIVEVTETVEDVEWRCAPLLAESIADGDTAGQAPADYARTHLEALALGVPTAGGVG